VNRLALPLIRLIAPHARLTAVQQVRQHPAVGHVGRRCHQRMNQLPLAVHSHVRLHPEIPRVAFLGLMHLRIPLSSRILGRTRRVDDRRVHNRPRADAQPLPPQMLVDPPENARPRSCRSSRGRNLHTVVSSGTGSFPRSIPAKWRITAESYSASSTAGSDRLKHCCRK
jgi:hypothetical protein